MTIVIVTVKVRNAYAAERFISRYRAHMNYHDYSPEYQIVDEVPAIVYGEVSYHEDLGHFKVKDLYLEVSYFVKKLLILFFKNPEKMYSRTNILDHLNHDCENQDNSVNALIKRLRRILKDAGAENTASMIKTEYGIGYVFIPG